MDSKGASPRKTRMLIVLVANLLLSLLVGILIYKAEKTNTPGKALPGNSNFAGHDSLPPTIKSDHSQNLKKAPETGDLAESKQESAVKKATGTAPSIAEFKGVKQAGENGRSVSASGRESFDSQGKNRTDRKRTQASFFVPPPPPYQHFDQAEPALSSRADAFSVPKKMLAEIKVEPVKLTAIIDKKAMLALRRAGASSKERPEIVCLSEGEEFKTSDNSTINVIGVEKESVVLEYNGRKFEKFLPALR